MKTGKKNTAASDRELQDENASSSAKNLQEKDEPRIKNPTIKKTLSTRKRKYNDEFLNFGFSCTMVNNEQRPICVICSNILANDSFKPVKLKRHLNTKHPEHVNKGIDFFTIHEKYQKDAVKSITKYTTVSSKAQRASFEVSLLIAKTMNSYNIGEKLVLPRQLKL